VKKNNYLNVIMSGNSGKLGNPIFKGVGNQADRVFI